MHRAIIVECVSCFVHGLHCVWCVFQGWDVGTLGNTLSGCITQYLRVSPLELGLCYPPYSPCLLGCTAVLSSLHPGVVFNSSKLTLIFTRPHLGYGQYGLTHLISGYEPVGTTVQIIPEFHQIIDTHQIREYPDPTISKVSTVLKQRMITMLNRKLLEKQRVQNCFASYEVHIGHFFLQRQRYSQFLKSFNPVYIQISKIFTGLTDRLTD